MFVLALTLFEQIVAGLVLLLLTLIAGAIGWFVKQMALDNSQQHRDHAKARERLRTEWKEHHDTLIPRREVDLIVDSLHQQIGTLIQSQAEQRKESKEGFNKLESLIRENR